MSIGIVRGAWLLGLVLLAGCVGPQGRQAEPMAVFTLETNFPAASYAKDGPVVLVSTPRARPGFDTERMAYVRRPNELEYFARHRWIDAPARMLAPLLVQALEATGAFSAVVPAPTVARAKWRLESEIVRLQQEFFDGPSRVQLVLRSQLIDAATQRPVAARVFSASVPAAGDDARSGAAAANEAARRLLPQLAAWCAEAVAQGQGPH